MLQRVKLSLVCFACVVLAVLSGCSSGGTLVKSDAGPDAKADAHTDGAADSTAPPDTTGMDTSMDSTVPMDTTGSQDTSTPDTSQDTSPLDTSAPDTTPPTDTSPFDTTPPTDTSPTDTSPIDSFTVGGSITGTMGETVTLQDNGGDNLPVSMDGSFTFATPLASGAAFNVMVLNQPANLSCSVTGGLGTVSGSNVTTVMVTCIPVLVDSGLMDTGTTDTGTTDSGTADTGTTDTGVADTGTADTGTADTGTADTGTADTGTVDSGTVDSGGPTFTIGGTIMGLAPGDSVQLELNGADATFFGTNGAFAFSMTLGTGATYAVTAKANPSTPTAQTCKITNGGGTVGAANVSSVSIACTTNSYTISGNVTLVNTGPDSITLRDNGGDMIIIAAGATSPAPFTFATALLSGTPYTVTATPAGAKAITCTAEPVGTAFQGVAANAPAMGTITDQNITGILFECQ